MATLTAQQQYSAITAAANAYGLSPQTLLGVYGTESAYGTNLGPSSAGARGPFQFLPSTGTKYGLNSTTINEFGPSLTAAAQYLKSLGANAVANSAQTIQALNNYNGNKGGTSLTSYASSVLSNGQTPAGLIKDVALAPSGAYTDLTTLLFGGGASSPTDIVGSTLGTGGTQIANAVGATNPISGIEAAVSGLFTNWLRIVEFLAGAVLGIFGLILLGKVGMKES